MNQETKDEIMIRNQKSLFLEIVWIVNDSDTDEEAVSRIVKFYKVDRKEFEPNKLRPCVYFNK